MNEKQLKEATAELKSILQEAIQALSASTTQPSSRPAPMTQEAAHSQK